VQVFKLPGGSVVFRFSDRTAIVFFFVLIFTGLSFSEPIELTLGNVIDFAINGSYRIKKLKIDIDRNMNMFKANQASLKSNVYMNIISPDLVNYSDIQQDQIVRHNTLLWQSDLAVRQPIILFGYPTNGYVSLNYRLYQFNNKEIDQSWNTNYYNRLFLKYEQPFFQPNELKNNIERSKLDVDDSKLSYLDGRMDIIRDIAYSYYYIYELANDCEIYKSQLEYLQQVKDSRQCSDNSDDSLGKLNGLQAELELSNVRENYRDFQNRFEKELANLKQRLRLPSDDSLYIETKFRFVPVNIDPADALDKSLKLNPYFRRQAIWKRKAELGFDSEKGRNSFNVKMEVTYGLEKSDPQPRMLADDLDNTNSVKVYAYVPIVDWGERKNRLAARQLDIERNDLEIEESKMNMKKTIAAAVSDVKTYQERLIEVQKSVSVAKEATDASIRNCIEGKLSIQDLLQVINRHKDTQFKMLGNYLGFRKALLTLMTETFYDFEKKESILILVNEDKK